MLAPQSAHRSPQHRTVSWIARFSLIDCPNPRSTDASFSTTHGGRVERQGLRVACLQRDRGGAHLFQRAICGGAVHRSLEHGSIFYVGMKFHAPPVTRRLFATICHLLLCSALAECSDGVDSATMDRRAQITLNETPSPVQEAPQPLTWLSELSGLAYSKRALTGERLG